MLRLQKKEKIFAVASILLIFWKLFKWIPELRSIYYYWGDYFSILLFTWIVMALFLCNIFIKKKWLAVCISIYFCIAAGLDAFMKIGDIMSLFDDYTGLDFMINLAFAIMSCIYIINTDIKAVDTPHDLKAGDSWWLPKASADQFISDRSYPQVRAMPLALVEQSI